MEEIKGQIAAILGNSEVVINRGEQHGVKVGMIFGIKLNIPDIVDPEDNTNVLKGLYYTKGKIRIETVREKMAFGSILPIRVYTSSPLLGSSYSFGGEQKTEYPLVSGKLLDEKAWWIRAGDEIYLIPAEKEQKKKE